MNILLIFLPLQISEKFTEEAATPPLALYTLAGVLKANGHSVKTIDPNQFINNSVNNYQHFIDFSYPIIENNMEDIDFIGFSSNTFNWGYTMIMANKIKKAFPHIPIVLGGLHPSIFDIYALDKTLADYVIRGEGEVTLIELIDAINGNRKLQDIHGLTYREEGQIIRNDDSLNLTVEELCNMPLPDYSLIPANKYTDFPVESSRGCAFSCAFCSIPHRNNWRGLDVESVCRRVEHAKKCLPEIDKSKSIIFVDDCFSIKVDRAVEIMNHLETHHDKVGYFIEVRVSNIIKDKLLERINPDLVTGMQIGVECGYDEGLKLVKKGMKIHQLYDALDIIVEHGYQNKGFLSFIIGFPWESEKEINQTLDTIEYIVKKYNVRCNLNWLLLLPSDLWKEREKYNINVDESIFDDPLWTVSLDVFYKVHPRITEDIVYRTEQRIFRLQAMGLKATYNRLNFRYEKSDMMMNRNRE